MNPIDYLNIPPAAALNQRIAIQNIVDAHDLNSADEKLLRDHISSIYLIAALNQDTIHVKSHHDEALLYEEIHLFKIELKQNHKFSSINQKLHTLFPNPTLIIYKTNSQYIYSLALKHLNKANPKQAVIDDVFTSDNSSLSDSLSEKFLIKTNLKAIKKPNLKEFYEELINIVYQQRLIEIIGDYPEITLNAITIKKSLKELEAYQTELSQLKEKAKSLQTMRSKMENHLSQKKIQEKIHSVISTIKEAL